MKGEEKQHPADDPFEQFAIGGVAAGLLMGGLLGYALGGRKGLYIGLALGLNSGLFIGYRYYEWWRENVHETKHPEAEPAD